MQAIRVHSHGDVSALRWESVPDPVCGAGEVGVRVHACGVNHLDIWVRCGVPGHTFPLPLTPGNDVAGVIYALGEGVCGVKVGDAVVVAPGVSCGACLPCLSGRDHHCRAYAILGEHRDGGYADKLVVPRKNVHPKPANLSFEAAAALGVAYLTAWHMLVARAQLMPGETVLIQAAGSGVGSAAVQIARLWGAEVIAVASTEAKLHRARALGAQHTILGSGDVAHEVKALTQGRGADVVFEHVGPATWEQSLRSLAWQGRLVTCGATTGAEVGLNLRHLFFKSQSILGSTMGSQGDFCQVLAHAAQGRLKPMLDRTLPMVEAHVAHTLLESRQVFGKVVLVANP